MNFDKIEQDAVISAMIKAKPKMDLIRSLTQFGVECDGDSVSLVGEISRREMDAALDPDFHTGTVPVSKLSSQFMGGLERELNEAIWAVCKKRIDELQESIRVDIAVPAAEVVANG